MRYRVLSLLFVLLVPCALTVAAPHSPGQSYVFLRIYDRHLEARLEITAADLDRVLHLGLSRDTTLVREQIRTHLDTILAYVDRHFYLGTSEGALPMRFASFDLRHIEIADYVLLRYVTEPLDPMPKQVEVEYSVLFEAVPRHRNLLVVEHNWKTATFNNERIVSAIFAPGETRQTLDLSSSSVLRGFLGLMKLGTWHIWIGLDHILFLLALALPSILIRENNAWKPVPSFRPALVNIATLVTIFTVAHSITLSLAALELVRLPAGIVEPVIAVSIAVAAFHNLYPRFVRWDRIIAFVFGLFHGFGFAYVLGEFGLEPRFVAYSLVGFNLGVEVGQIAILLLIFPVLYLLRKRAFYTPLVLRYGSMLLIGLALVWFTERAFDVQIIRSPQWILQYVMHLFL